MYRIHFGFSKRSKRYPQALELAQLAHHHQIIGDAPDEWHIVTFTEDQIDLMAALYEIASRLPRPTIYGADILLLHLYCVDDHKNYPHDFNAPQDPVRLAAEKLMQEKGTTLRDLAQFVAESYWNPWQEDMVRVTQKLREEGYLASYVQDQNGDEIYVRATKRPREYIEPYANIRDSVSNARFAEAIQLYYQTLGHDYYGPLHSELIYLKRIANAPLQGRDLLFFRSESSRTDFIAANLDEYSACIDSVLESRSALGLDSPIDILTRYAPTMDELIRRTEHEWHMGVYLWDGQFKRDTTAVSSETFSQDECPKGRIFDRYPDQVRFCNLSEAPEDPRYAGLWTTHSPEFYKKEIIDKGLHLNGLNVYRHKSWRKLSKKRDPDFLTVVSPHDIESFKCGVGNIRYTGRSHDIAGVKFYEVDLLRKDMDRIEHLGNPFLEVVDEILREAENVLRERHGLPRIGEGWYEETRLFNLVRDVFPDVQHHASPEWLKPQHLDVYVPSHRLAIEYQGRQHFEPVDFFGGQHALEKTRKHDERKTRKCSSNGVVLILWRYDEPIDRHTLIRKLEENRLTA